MTAADAVGLWMAGRIEVTTVATALPLAFQITNMAGWVARSITGIFENIGLVQDGMRSIAVPRQMPDAPGASRPAAGGWRHPLRERAASATAPSAACCTGSTSPWRPASASA